MSNTIPADWKKNKFENLFNIAIGGTPSRNEPLFWDAECKTGNYWVSIRDLKGRIISQTAEQITDLGIKKSNVKLVPKGTVIMSFKLSVGRVAFAGRDLYTNEAIAAFQPINEKAIDLQYFYQGLHSWDLLGDIDQAVKGVTLNKEKLRNIEAILPPLPEQQKIAAILTSVDDVIEKTQAQIDKLKDLKSGMMQELLTKGVGVDGKPHTEFKDSPVGRIPKMWKMAPLSNVCELQVGYAFKSTWFVDAGIKLLRGDNVGFGTATWERTKYLSKHEANNYQDYQLSRGDIIIGMDRTFTKSGVKITKLSIEDTPSLLVQRVGRFLPKSTCDDDFLWQLLRSSQYLDALKGQEKGMDIPHLSKSEILTPYVVIPPLEEQKIIARTLRSVDDMIERNSKKLISNNLLKKALMQDLLTGKVRVTID